MDPTTRLILTASLVLLSAVLASRGASRFGIPSLLVFLGIGVVFGAGGSGAGFHVTPGLAQDLGVVALLFILFSGGLDTDLDSVRPVMRRGLALATFGVLVSSGLVAAFAVTALGFGAWEGLLLGAAISATDVAAVFTVLRGRSSGLSEGLKPLLELESAVNDPVTVLLSVGVLGALAGAVSSPYRFPLFLVLQAGIGLLVGYAGARGAKFLINRVRLEFEGLYPVLSVALTLLIFSVSQAAGGSGFLAVYLAGILLGNSELLHKRSLAQFHDGVAWLMQIAMFLVMGLLIEPRELLGAAPRGLALVAFTLLVARPASVFASLAGSRFSSREKLMVSWAGLRGAVPIILATYPLTAGIPHARQIFHLVFFIVAASVLLQGTTIPRAAALLGVSAPDRPRQQ